MSCSIASRSFFFWRLSRHEIWRQRGNSAAEVNAVPSAQFKVSISGSNSLSVIAGEIGALFKEDPRKNDRDNCGPSPELPQRPQPREPGTGGNKGVISP